MRKIIGYFRVHISEGLSWQVHLATAVLLAALLVMNYTLNLERGILNPRIGNADAYLWFFLLYGGTYYLTAVLQAWISGRWQPLKTGAFWLRSGLFLGVLVLNSASSFHVRWVYTSGWIDGSWKMVVYQIMMNAGSALLFIVPLALLWWWLDRKSGFGFYGLSRKGFYPAPYLLLLLAMVPLVLWAGTQADFLSTYPTFSGRALPLGDTILPPIVSTLAYQLFYGLDFIGVELLFRGALVLGMVGVFGRDALLPMVAVYCVLHFGKPVGEAVSSIFGGYILGVIALYGRNIWGGAMVHIGIALMMEWVAIWRN